MLSLYDEANNYDPKKKSGKLLSLFDDAQNYKSSVPSAPIEQPKTPTKQPNFIDQLGKESHDAIEGFKESVSGRNLKSDKTQGSGVGKNIGEFLGPLGGAVGSGIVGSGIGTAIAPGLGTLGGAIAGGGYGLWRGFSDYSNRKREEGKNPNLGTAIGHGLIEGGLNTIAPGVGGGLLKRIGTNAGLGALGAAGESALDQQTEKQKIDLGKVGQDALTGAASGALLGEGMHVAGKVGGAIVGKVLPKAKAPISLEKEAEIYKNTHPTAQKPIQNPLSLEKEAQAHIKPKNTLKPQGKANDIAAIKWGAEQLGVTPEELASVIALESGFKADIWGGDNKGYFGLIQFGAGARKETGLDPKVHNTIESQIPFVVNYFKKRGFKASDYPDPRDRQTALYSTVLAGSPNRKYWGSKDSNKTSAARVAERMLTGDLRQRAKKYLGSAEGGSYTPVPTDAPDYSLVPNRYVPKNTGGPDSRVELFPIAERISEDLKVDHQVVKNIISADKKWNLEFPEQEIADVATNLRKHLDENGGNYEKAIADMSPKADKERRVKHILGQDYNTTPEAYAKRAAEYESDPYIESGRIEDLFPTDSNGVLDSTSEPFDYNKAISDLLKTPESSIDENLFNKAKKSNKTKAKVSNQIDKTIKDVALSGQHDPLLDLYTQAKEANSLDLFINRLDKMTQQEINDLGRSIGC